MPSDLAGKTVAIDALNLMYAFYAVQMLRGGEKQSALKSASRGLANRWATLRAPVLLRDLSADPRWTEGRRWSQVAAPDAFSFLRRRSGARSRGASFAIGAAANRPRSGGLRHRARRSSPRSPGSP